MKELKKYEECEIEIISLSDIVTSSSGFDGDLDEFDFGNSVDHTVYQW